MSILVIYGILFSVIFMKIIGINAEYNPFHLGHLYQINKIKELYPNSLIIVIVSIGKIVILGVDR